MVDNKMYIPKTVKVGFQNRPGTYTGKLAYIIYFDDKGTLRKEKSWQTWRDNKIDPEEFANEPTEGFVLNKKAGGYSTGWNHRNTYVRVYDPRNFEFEISVPNLLFILQECSAIKGKGLEGEFVYAWDGTELVLLPAGCDEYKKCVEHTARQKKKVTKKDMKEGFSYTMKDGKPVMYLGRLPYNEPTWSIEFHPYGKKHIFVVLGDEKDDRCYIAQPGFTKVAECTSESALTSYPDELDKFKASINCGDVVDIAIKKAKITFEKISYHGRLNHEHRILLEKSGDGYQVVTFERNRYNFWARSRGQELKYTISRSKSFKPEIKDGAIKLPSAIATGITYTESDINQMEWFTLSVVTTGGKHIRVG